MVETALKSNLETFQVKGLEGISKPARRFLKQDPRHAELAVRNALETAARKYGYHSPSDKVPDVLKPFVVIKPIDENIINVTEAAKRLNVSRTTIYSWIEKGLLLAWKNTKNGQRIPSEQILGEGQLVDGIDKVIRTIGNPVNAWIFLSNEMSFSHRPARPIDLLKEGKIEEVLGSAAGFGSVPT